MSATAIETHKRNRRPADGWTPPRLARRFGVNPDKILTWIRRGELTAVNVATRPGGRPRWIVLPDALERFELSRSSTASVSVKPQRRRRQPLGVTEYF